MLKRFVFLVSVIWSALCIYNGVTRPHGMESIDVFLSTTPWALVGAGRWIIAGR